MITWIDRGQTNMKLKVLILNLTNYKQIFEVFRKYKTHKIVQEETENIMIQMRGGHIYFRVVCIFWICNQRRCEWTVESMDLYKNNKTKIYLRAVIYQLLSIQISI